MRETAVGLAQLVCHYGNYRALVTYLHKVKVRVEESQLARDVYRVLVVILDDVTVNLRQLVEELIVYLKEKELSEREELFVEGTNL